MGTAKDTQSPDTRHVATKGSRSSSNPEAVVQLSPHSDKRKQGKRCEPEVGSRRAPAALAQTRGSEGPSRVPTMAELGEADEAELQRLVAAEQQKAQFTAQVHHFMELCWDKCVEKPGNRLDSRTENCLSSCVDRFIDTTLAITSRFAQIVQKGGQ